MRAKASVFIATSLDGFISRPDGSIDWLEKVNATIPEGEDCGYKAFMESVDVLVMGRNTFEQVVAFDPWPYGDKPVVVLSSKPLTLPAKCPPQVTTSSETPEALVERLSSEGIQHLYVDGGVTIQRFLRAGLINAITVTLIPVLLGEGKPLFAALGRDQALVLKKCNAYPFGLVQVTYEVTGEMTKTG